MAKLSLPLPDKLQKSMFWIVIGVLALVLLVVWILATGSVANQTSKQITEIEGYFTTATGINPTANQKTVDAIKAEVEKRKKNMMDAWKRVDDRQKQELVWPEQVLGPNPKPGLPKEFVDATKKLPAAPEWLDPRVEPLRLEHKEMFRNTAKGQIQTLCDIISSVNRIEGKTAAQPSATAAANQTEDVPLPGDICLWTTASQQSAAQLLQFAEGSNPLTQDIMYAQESMWVYQSLFKIIKATNDSIKESKPPKDLAHYNAPVKMIHEISIGEKFDVKEEAAKPAALVEGGDAEPVKIPDELLKAGERFVNERGQRLKPEQLFALGKPGKYPEQAPIPAQYKLMPVFMRLEVDQRFLGRLLVECANSPLTVEVKDISFKVLGHADREANKGSAEAAGANMGPKTTKNFYDITVEITGHIYLYFPTQKADVPAEEAPATPEGTPATEEATAAAGG